MAYGLFGILIKWTKGGYMLTAQIEASIICFNNLKGNGKMTLTIYCMQNMVNYEFIDINGFIELKSKRPYQA